MTMDTVHINSNMMRELLWYEGLKWHAKALIYSTLRCQESLRALMGPGYDGTKILTIPSSILERISTTSELFWRLHGVHSSMI